MSGHLLVEAAGDRRGEVVGGLDDGGAAAAIRRDLERGYAGVALCEVDDVGDVRTSPLVDGLVVIADDAELGLRSSQEFDESFLGGIDVLVLVHDEMPQRPVEDRP